MSAKIRMSLGPDESMSDEVMPFERMFLCDVVTEIAGRMRLHLAILAACAVASSACGGDEIASHSNYCSQAPLDAASVWEQWGYVTNMAVSSIPALPQVAPVRVVTTVETNTVENKAGCNASFLPIIVDSAGVIQPFYNGEHPARTVVVSLVRRLYVTWDGKEYPVELDREAVSTKSQRLVKEERWVDE